MKNNNNDDEIIGLKRNNRVLQNQCNAQKLQLEEKNAEIAALENVQNAIISKIIMLIILRKIKKQGYSIVHWIGY